MFETGLTAIISFVSTNIDDLFVLMFLYLQVDRKREKLSVLAGRYIGMAIILAVSFLGAFGLRFVSGTYLGLLGIIPIALGIKEWITNKRSKRSDLGEGENGAPMQPLELRKKGSVLLSTVILTVSNGADNIGVYIPLFTGFSTENFVVFLVIFALMTALWCFFSAKFIHLHSLKEKLQRYQNILVPITFIVLGIYIIFKNYL